jgi:hypothetical protein
MVDIDAMLQVNVALVRQNSLFIDRPRFSSYTEIGYFRVVNRPLDIKNNELCK